MFCLSALSAPTPIPSLPCPHARGFAIRCLQTFLPTSSFLCPLPVTSTGHCSPQSPLSAISGSDGFLLWDRAKDGCSPLCPHGLYFWLKTSVWVLLKRRDQQAGAHAWPLNLHCAVLWGGSQAKRGGKLLFSSHFPPALMCSSHAYPCFSWFRDLCIE